MAKLILGLVAKPSGGKESTGNLIEFYARAGGLTVSKHRFSDILNETLTAWGIPIHRENLQLMARVMKAFGDDTLSKAVRARFEHDLADIVIVDGMRWLADEVMIRSFPHGHFIFVDAKQELRFEREKNRKRHAGDAGLAWEEFLRRDDAENEIYVPEIGARADWRLDNNGTFDEFSAATANLWRESLAPLLRTD